MKNILTDEEKKYLQRNCRYLNSYNLDEGYYRIEFENEFEFDDDIQFHSFDNAYDVEILPGLENIFKKILKHIVDQNLITYSTKFNYFDYQQLEIFLDCNSNQVSVSYNYTVTIEGDPQSMYWNENDDDKTIEHIFETLDVLNSKGEKQFDLSYDGSGDSGYINDEFTNGLKVPDLIENWCYNQLENFKGGWEINEGSRGEFTFDFVDRTIQLWHIWNEVENHSDTIWEEKF